MNRSHRSVAGVYGVALVSLAAAILIRWLLDPVLGDALPLATLFAAIAVAVWVGGWRPAVLVTVLGYTVCHALFMSPRGGLDLSSARNVVGFLMFLGSAAVIIVFGDALRRSRQSHRLGEAAARGQAELMRITLASIGDGVIATDREGRITSMNAVAEALTGWRIEEASGVPLTRVFRIVEESTRHEVENPAMRALKDGMVVGLANHTVLIAKDGTEWPIDDSAAPIRSSDGEVVGCVLVFRDISERHRAENRTREAQLQIASTLESVTDGLIRYDSDWRILYVNTEAERLVQSKRSDLLGRIVWEVFPALVGTRLEAEFRRAVSEQVTIEVDNFYAPLDRWYSVKGYPTPDGGLTAFIRDKTEQKRTEEQLAESEARYRAIGESIDYGVWMCDASGRNTYASESFLRMVGITQQQCSEFGWSQVLHPDEVEATVAAWKECVRTEGRWDRVHRFKGVDGQWHHVLARGIPLRDAEGRVLGWAGMNLDVTRMMNAEQEILRLAAESDRQRRLYETVLTNTPDFVYVFSLDHKVVYANEALIKMWGRGREGAIGKTFLEIGYEPWHAEMHDREIDQVRATRQPIRGEVPFNGTNGRRIYDYIFVPVFGADGEVEAVAGTTRDVTERKETEDQLRRNHDTFFALIQNTPFGVYVVDADFRLRQVSMGAQKVFATVNPLLGRDFAEVLRSLWLEPFASEAIGRFRHTLDTGEPYASPSSIEQRADIGAVEAYDWRIERITLPDGRFGVVCYFYDLSERQRWEATLRDNEERLRLATGAADLGIWTWEPAADIVVWENDRPYEIFALPRTDPPVTADRFRTEFLHPEDRETFETALTRTREQKVPLLCECRIRRTDGALRWVEFTGRVVEGEDEARLIGTVQDITDRKQAEEVLRVSEARNSFLVTLADTIRPLSDPMAVQAEASRVLGERLGANRVVYFEVRGEEFVVERDYIDGARSIVGRYPITSFSPGLLAKYSAGRTATDADVEAQLDLTPDERGAFAALEIRSYVGVPLVKEGRFVAGLSVHSALPRAWKQSEIAMIEDTAERTWSAVERLRAEAALRASEEGRRLALEAAELGTFNIDPATHSLVTDERFRMIFAGSTDELGYEQAIQAIHPGDRARIREAVAAVIRSEDPGLYAQEHRVVHPDGSIRWVFAQGRAKFIGAGERAVLVSFDGTVADITARKEAELQAHESEQRFRVVADAAPVLIWMAGPDKLCYWFNQPWLHFTGRSIEQEMGDGWIEGVNPEDLERCQQTYAAAFEAREPFSMEYRLRRHDGEYRWLIHNGVPRYRSDGEFEGYIGSCLDVTDYKDAEAALRDADRRKDEFIATLAHELRNPLAPIRLGLQVMRLAGSDGTVEQVRSMMDRQLKQLIRLVDDLLNVSRMTSGKLELHKEQVDLKSVIEVAVETSRPVIDQAGHELVVSLPDEPIHLYGDATRLSQVVSNLLNNSAKYTHRGGLIRLEVTREGGTAVVTVIDNGIGIPPLMLDRVFEMFTQVDRALEKVTGGLGIGLSLVKGLVEMHGGTIEARSEGEGLGSQFVVRLPLLASAVERVEPPPAPAIAESSSGRRVLVADDNADSVEWMGQLLELLGYSVSAASDGLQAVELAEAVRPDVVLLDIGMPKLNGYEACRRIREQPWGKHAMLIALTGWGQDEDKRRSQEAGFDHHLVKPVEISALETLLVEFKPQKG